MGMLKSIHRFKNGLKNNLKSMSDEDQILDPDLLVPEEDDAEEIPEEDMVEGEDDEEDDSEDDEESM